MLYFNEYNIDYKHKGTFKMRILLSFLFFIFSAQFALAFSCTPPKPHKVDSIAIFEMKNGSALLVEQKGRHSFVKDKKYKLKVAYCPAAMEIKDLNISDKYILFYSQSVPFIKDNTLIFLSSECCGLDRWSFHDSLEEAQKVKADEMKKN